MHAAGPAQALWKASATGDLLPASREVLSGRQKACPALPPCTLSSVTQQLRAERRHCSTVGLRRFRRLRPVRGDGHDSEPSVTLHRRRLLATDRDHAPRCEWPMRSACESTHIAPPKGDKTE